MEINNKFILSLMAIVLMQHPALADDPETAAAPEEPSVVNEGFAGNYLSGRFAQSSGDVPDAIHFLGQAHGNNPDDIEVTSQLQATYLLDGHVEEATKLAEEVQKAGKKDAISSLLLTLRAVKQNDLTKADAALAPAFDTDSGQLWLPLVSAWLDIGQKRLTKPVTIESLSTDVGRATAVVNYHLALINAQAGFKDAAIQNFKNAIENPKNPPERVMEALLQFYNKNDSPEALTPIVNAYREANPDSDLDDQTPPVASVQDGVAEVLFTMGSIMMSADATQDAVIYLRLALYVRPDFSVAAVTMGDAYSELQQMTKSNDAYAVVAEKSRFYTSAQLHIAMNLDHMNKFKDALALLDKMAKANPADSLALTTKGDLLRGHSKYAEAIEAYNQALSRVPADSPAQWPILFARGVCFERQGKWSASEKDFQKALAVHPDQPEVLNYLAYSWLQRGEHIDEARAMIEKAVKARPNDPEIVDSMGWALFLAGQYNDAAPFIEKALESLPSDATVNDHLGDVYWKQGRKTEARYQWERSLSFSPEAPEAVTLRKKLKEGLPETSTATQKTPVVASEQRAENPTP
jgi:tetratricopeptide (TPR) repeat protein